MHQLSPDDQATIRAALTADRVAVLGSVAALSRDEAAWVATQTSGENRLRGEGGEGDTVAVERNLVARLTSQAQTALAEIDEALRRLDDGRYGTCEGCTNPIPAERLQVRPRTTVCVPCASRR